MNREQTLAILSKHKPERVKRIGVKRLALFASTARDGVGSDSDIVVSFYGYLPLQNNTLKCNSF